MVEILNKLSDAMASVASSDSIRVQESPVDEVWALLRRLFAAQRRRLLTAAAQAQLQPAQAGALLQLEEPLPMHELAYLLGCDSSNVTGLIDRLEERGLVLRRPSAEDRRVKHVVLTPAGRRLRRQLLATVSRPVDGFERLSVSQQRQLRELLRAALAD